MKRVLLAICAALCVFTLYTGAGFVCAEEGALTRLEFYETVMQILEQRGTISHFSIEYEPFLDVSNVYVNEAYALGLVKGDGSGYFYPDNTMTREQAAVALKRIQDYIVPRLIYDNRKAAPLEDREEIASYAESSVVQLTMTGTVGGGRFFPKEGAGREFVQGAMDHIYRDVVNQPVSHLGALASKRTPVLMYHTIEEAAGRPFEYLYVAPERFEEQIRYLSENGYTFLFPDELYYADYCEKSVVITFDDGYADNYTTAYPILKKYNAKATVFVACSNIDQPGMLTKAQIREMADSGVINIGSHSLTHQNLTTLAPDVLMEEMAGSQWLLEQITGKKITNVAYPYGAYNNAVTAQAKRYFACGFTVTKGQTGAPYSIRRETVDGRAGMQQFKNILNRY